MDARATRHTIRELAVSLGAMAALASFEELALSPKPGLVDPIDSGSHDDMSWITFAQSASALAPVWREQALDGIVLGCLEPSDDLHVRLQARGVDMERKMFAATGGVNTHKGLIFSLSLIVAAAGACIAGGDSSPGEVCARAGVIAGPLVGDDFRRIRTGALRGERLTHGEKIFIEYGIGGIRNEALSGFRSVFSALVELEDAAARGASFRNAALTALLSLMLDAEDTNIIHRSGIGFWRGEYREKITMAKARFDPLGDSCVPLLELNRFLISHSASPGGAADLLACALFLYRVKTLYDKYTSSVRNAADEYGSEIYQNIPKVEGVQQTPPSFI
jgi:triphosphoribosyl-dephospho-CoA synthetase